MKINMKLLPLKAHWFFFMAASGPILPFLTVYGKQLGISEVVMGSITAVLPIAFLITKPIFGFILDYFHKKRKILFMCLIIAMSSFYVLLYFVPPPPTLLEVLTSESINLSQILFENNETKVDNSSELSAIPISYNSATFYTFVLLMSLSMVGYNVANSISDAICFDMLGAGSENKYGQQRVWGAIGFGLTALLGGLGMDLWSEGGIKNYTPAFILVLTFTFIDVIFCSRLRLPKMGHSAGILRDVRWVLQQKRIVIFLWFTVLAGILESFIIYFMFWFLEDLSHEQGQMSSIKILEGLIVAAETLGGEVIFFPLSGKILERLGHGHTFTLCFFTYAIRLGLISLIPTPWWLLPIEFFMQGATFALCYTTIVVYAGAIAPPGTSATMQGLVAGLDDGIGFALGSLIGGFLYREVGGRLSFQIFSAAALITCVAHACLYRFVLSRVPEPGHGSVDIQYGTPDEALKITDSPAQLTIVNNIEERV